MNKLILVSLAMGMATATPALAGGLLTNTNQNIAFLRNPARDGVIAIDGVYSNPAGVAFLAKGLHLSLNNQSAFQTRTINSGMTLTTLEGTAYEHPLQLNGGDENGVKTFKGKASAPIVPSFQAALNYDNWGFQANFSLCGGGGKCTFNNGLGSFERQVALLPVLLQQANQTYYQKYGVDLGLSSSTPGYSVSSYLHGQQYVFGLQLGTTYKFNKHLAVYGGFRFNYIYNKYEGNITKITVNIAGNNENLYEYLGNKVLALEQQANTYTQTASSYTVLADQATESGNTEAAAKYKAAAQQFTEGAKLLTGGAQTLESVQGQVADKYLNCTQRGWAITPIIGVDYKWDKLNIGAKLEFTTHFNIQNDTERDDTGLYTDGVNTPGDMPGIFTIGAQYEVLPQLRVMAGYHYFFDKDARMDQNKQRLLSGNTQEFNAGAEYDVTKAIQVSAGIQKTNYGLGDGSFLNDISFVTSSYSIGFGAGVKIAKNIKANVAYFWTTYDKFHKTYTENYTVAGNTITAQNTDEFTRTNQVFGVGLDIDL
jgi:hypothetical protein